MILEKYVVGSLPHDKTLIFMEALSSLGGTYVPFRDFGEPRKIHTSGRRELRRPVRFVPEISEKHAVTEISMLGTEPDSEKCAASRKRLNRTYCRMGRGYLKRVLVKA